MNKLPSDTTFDKIQAYYLGEEIELSDKNEEVRQRLEAVHAYQLEYEADKDIIDMMMTRFNISRGQAYRDIRTSESLFGNIRQANKDILRYMVTEKAKSMYKSAKDDADLKYMEKALNIIVKANALDKDDIDLPDPDKIQPPTQVIMLSPDFLASQFANVIDDKGKKKVNEVLAKVKALLAETQIESYLDSQTIDIPFIQVDDNS